MKQRFRLYKRKKGGRYYVHDDVTGKQESLGTSEQQPAVNLQIARAYLAASDPQIATRNWQLVMDEMVKLKKDQTQHRWQTAIKDKAFDYIRHLPILETRPEHFLRVLENGTVSTNVYLRRIHNFALDMTWLPWPVLARKRWPAVKHGEKRGITLAEHLAIVARETNPERKAYYQLAWYLGASQMDLAFLTAENVDWQNHVISYERNKTRSIAIMRMDEDMEEVLRDLPGSGPLFPYLRTVRSGDRATEFHQRCVGLGIKGVSLHSYRYAWAECSLVCRRSLPLFGGYLLRLGNHLGERRSQSIGNRLCCVQVRTPFFTFQKANVRLMQASFLCQFRTTKPALLTMLFYHL